MDRRQKSTTEAQWWKVGKCMCLSTVLKYKFKVLEFHFLLLLHDNTVGHIVYFTSLELFDKSFYFLYKTTFA